MSGAEHDAQALALLAELAKLYVTEDPRLCAVVCIAVRHVDNGAHPQAIDLLIHPAFAHGVEAVLEAAKEEIAEELAERRMKNTGKINLGQSS